MTKYAIEKLSENARHYCEIRQRKIRDYRDRDKCIMEISEKNRLTGYLQAMVDFGVITDRDFTCLYIFYGTM